jgi:4-amino-4-deoxy-L-arabinose transferase-like glycosyltransferase
VARDLDFVAPSPVLVPDDPNSPGTRPRSFPLYWPVVVACLALIVAVSWRNETNYPIYGGYDESAHQVYADVLAHRWHIPSAAESTESRQPPAFYLVAGLAERAAAAADLSDPWKAARSLNAVWAVGAALLVLALARLLFPQRRGLHLAAVGFVSLLPVLHKTTAMFHPEPLSLVVSTLGVFLAARMLVHRRPRIAAAAATGAVLGVAELVRPFAAWVLAAVVVAFLSWALWDRLARREVVVATAVVVASAVIVVTPWFVHQAVVYGSPLAFNRTAPSTPLWRRRPASFYFSPGLPDVFANPTRPHFVNRAVPTVYSEIWGDYFGSFAWGAPTPPTPAVARQLRLQNVLGLLPTALALAGLVGLLRLALRRREPALVLVGTLPLAALAGFLLFAVSYPSPDGDVIKASYMLTAAPAWALAFAYATVQVARNRLLRAGLVVVLLASAFLDLGFVMHDSPFAGLL